MEAIDKPAVSCQISF